MIEKTKEEGDFSGSGSRGAFNVSARELESFNAEGGRIGASSGGGGLGASKYSGGDSTAGEGHGSRQTAGSTTTTTSGGHGKRTKRAPNTTRKEEILEPGLDWSKVPKDIERLPEVGSPEDPGRLAEIHLLAQKARRDFALAPTVRGGDNENPYETLSDDESAPETRDPTRV